MTKIYRWYGLASAYEHECPMGSAALVIWGSPESWGLGRSGALGSGDGVWRWRWVMPPPLTAISKCHLERHIPRRSPRSDRVGAALALCLQTMVQLPVSFDRSSHVCSQDLSRQRFSIGTFTLCSSIFDSIGYKELLSYRSDECRDSVFRAK